jgi:hypothetical protein
VGWEFGIRGDGMLGQKENATRKRNHSSQGVRKEKDQDR